MMMIVGLVKAGMSTIVKDVLLGNDGSLGRRTNGLHMIPEVMSVPNGNHTVFGTS